jgi:hypothetical protein
MIEAASLDLSPDGFKPVAAGLPKGIVAGKGVAGVSARATCGYFRAAGKAKGSAHDKLKVSSGQAEQESKIGFALWATLAAGLIG